MIDFEAATKADLERHQEHFPSGGDLTLQILKGHLLVEELLRELLISQLAFPDAVQGKNNARFSFHQVICLVQAVTKHSDKAPWIWVAAKRLNTIRNDLAHKLKPDRLEQDVQTFISYVTNEEPTILQLKEQFGVPDGHELELIIMALCNNLSTLKVVIQDAKLGKLPAA